RATAVLMALAAGATTALPAQIPLGGGMGAQTGVTFEQWRFGCCSAATPETSVRQASEWTVPITADVSLGRVSIDAYAAWMRGEVTLRGPDQPTYHLDGVTDTYLRAGVHLAGDALLLTVGANVPTGKTTLDGGELNVLDVVGAPALRYQTPVLGTGWGGTTGLVYTARAGEWSWGFGASYEYRGQYSPAQAAALGLGTGDFDLRPGQAIRVSVGSDGLVGQSAMTMSLASTFYTQDRVALSAGGTPPEPLTLGPMFTAQWQLRAAAGAFRELSVYAFDRYRMSYHRDGQTVAGTNGNELEFGTTGRIPMGRSLGFVASLRGRYHTGLSIDASLPTAGIVAAGGDVGFAWDAGRFELRPTVGGEFGRLDTGLSRFDVHKLEAALTISAH
ncbi:MAG TPA: hypothetical protein VIC55_10585, partial [Gemmatimonadaceae bacterium]